MLAPGQRRSYNAPMATTQYISDHLCHFWPHISANGGFKIFESVVTRGLLLTCSTCDVVDEFPYEWSDGSLQKIALGQAARVCFTDIPEDKLDEHCSKFGGFAVGFQRATVVSWGGLPVWYLPNHHKVGARQHVGGELVYNVANASMILDSLADVIRAQGLNLQRTLPDGTVAPLTPDESVKVLTSSAGALRLVTGFMKEMSRKSGDDHFYLYEREWRLVEMPIKPSPFRELTDAEKAELLAIRSAWGEPPPIPDSKRPHIKRLIDNFRFFNGPVGGEPISRLIDLIVVPDDKTAEKVRQYVAAEPTRFCTNGPRILSRGGAPAPT